MVLLGLTGRARSGKSIVSRAIEEYCVGRLDCKIYEISEYVLADLNRLGYLPGKTRPMLTKDELSILVEHGHRMRSINTFHWMEYIAEEMNKDRPDVAIIPNIRFLNEAYFIRGFHRGKVIRVRSLIKDGLDYISPDRDPNDPMEYENLSIEADYFLTAKRGQSSLLRSQAASLFQHILEEGTIH